MLTLKKNSVPWSLNHRWDAYTYWQLWILLCVFSCFSLSWFSMLFCTWYMHSMSSSFQAAARYGVSSKLFYHWELSSMARWLQVDVVSVKLVWCSVSEFLVLFSCTIKSLSVRCIIIGDWFCCSTLESACHVFHIWTAWDGKIRCCWCSLRI